MTDQDLPLAFQTPEARSRATAQGQPLDRILLSDHIAEADIGAFQKERGHRQRLRFNVVVEVRPAAEPIGDDVDRILSYDLIVEAIALALSEERLNLLETLAERVAELVLLPEQAVRAFVRIEKLDLGPHALGVEIVRRRPDALPPAPIPAPRPRVVFLPEAAIHSPALSRLIDRLEAMGDPLILCVGPAPLPSPRADIAPAQRRIDLLAIEQNAWVLSGRDPRCVVVATRTELDWAARKGQTTVWAPSKMVLDAVRRPQGDARALALWLAAEERAVEVLTVGEDPPEGAPCPARRIDLPD